MFPSSPIRYLRLQETIPWSEKAEIKETRTSEGTPLRAYILILFQVFFLPPHPPFWEHWEYKMGLGSARASHKVQHEDRHHLCSGGFHRQGAGGGLYCETYFRRWGCWGDPPWEQRRHRAWCWTWGCFGTEAAVSPLQSGDSALIRCISFDLNEPSPCVSHSPYQIGLDLICVSKRDTCGLSYHFGCYFIYCCRYLC